MDLDDLRRRAALLAVLERTSYEEALIRLERAQGPVALPAPEPRQTKRGLALVPQDEGGES